MPYISAMQQSLFDADGGMEALAQQFSNPGMSKLVAEVGQEGGSSYDYKVTRMKR